MAGIQKSVGAESYLEKKLSPINVWALAFGCIIGWGAFLMPGDTFLKNAGPLGTAIAIGIAVGIMIVIALNYNYMINKYPVAGGEFAYTKYTFGNTHAFICSWFLGLSYLAIVPLNATALALIGRNLLGGIFQVGFHYDVAGYDVYLGEILLADAALILFAWLSVRGVRFAGGVQTCLTIALALGVIVIAGAALLNPKISIHSLSPAFYPGKNSVSGILSVVAVAPWAFVGFDTVPQAAEEFRFSPGKTKGIMVVSILFGGLVYVTLTAVTAAVVPDGYASWAEYIDNLENLEGLAALPTFYAAHLLLGNAGLVFLGIAVLAAVLSGIIGFYMAASRLFFFMANEHVLPGAFGELNSTYHTPLKAILFILAVSLVAPFFGRTVLGWVVDMSSLGAAVGYGYTSAAAFYYARREGNKPMMAIGIVGTLLAVIFALLLLVPVPLLGCSLGKESYICLMVWTLLGIIFYRCSQRKNIQQGENLVS